mgnify:CR=1 FL=1
MTLLGTGLRRILLLLVIAIAIILIALNIILNIKLRADIPNIIDKFSKESPYQIDIQNISLDPFFRLQLDKVSILDPSSEIKDVLIMTKNAIEAGAYGVTYGRNVWQAEDPVKVINGLKMIIHENKDIDEVLEYLENI